MGAVIGSGRRAFIVASVLVAMLLLPLAALAASEKPSGGADAASTPSAKLQALTDLLADPDIRALLSQRESGTAEAPAPTAPSSNSMAVSLADRLQWLRSHLINLLAATQTLPGEADTARSMVASALDKKGWWTAATFFVGFVALGFGTEWLFRLAMRPAQRWLLALTLESVDQRVRAVFARLVYGLGLVLSFGLGSVGAFLAFDWPIVVKEILLGYLIAFLLVRVASVVGRILLAPGAQRFRVVPITTPAATFLYWRWLALAVLLGFGWQTIALFDRFGLSDLSSELLGDAVGLAMLAVGFDVLWRAPHASLAIPGSQDGPSFVTRHRAAFAISGTLLITILWMLWVVSAKKVFWLTGFAAALPIAIMIARRSVNHILRPPGLAMSSGVTQTLDVIVFERGIRSVVIVAAALLLGRILDVNFVSLTMEDTLTTRFVRGAVSVIVIGLLADFIWHVIKALIDRRITSSLLAAAAEDAGHAARLQTLLPIISNILRIVIIGVAGMMMLASAGVQIGPLIASAGVVGVAIGFGAQTLVKDIISGIFYLLDDAFRIGEYIQSGSFKGTVESFSLRSVKLRHQRGALYTVPFGILGAVQNQSRDWVVDKIVMNVPYGTDLDRVRKLIKRIGEALQDDPELGPDIIHPIKMQGVVQFGDFAIQIQTKMMTKPGDVQFAARRRALLMINQSFVDNGIGFAMPMVHVAGGAESNGAAAAITALDMAKAARAG